METSHEEFVDWEMQEPDEVYDEDEEPTEPSYSSRTTGDSDRDSSNSSDPVDLSQHGSSLYSADSWSNPFQERENDAGASHSLTFFFFFGKW